jgi:hypothetical protein
MARQKPVKKQKKSITSYIFLIIGLVIVVVVATSWFAFPDWHAASGGFWTLIGAAAVGVIAIAKDAIEILKNLREMESQTDNKKGSNAGGTNNAPTVGDNLQLGAENKLRVNHNKADVSRNRQIGKGNEISVGPSKTRRSGRS